MAASLKFHLVATVLLLGGVYVLQGHPGPTVHRLLGLLLLALGLVGIAAGLLLSLLRAAGDGLEARR